MNEQELRDVVIRALTEVAPDIDPAGIDPEMDLADQLDIDSIDFLNVVVAVHEQTGIEIPERDYPKLSTLDDAVAYLLAAQRRGAGADA
ncbi:MAG: acyl carrier protein [Solirubrobacteraceae bacterium]